MDQTSKIPVLVSALACPGAGRLIQRRWLAGTLFICTFLIFFFRLVSAAFRIIAAYYALAYDMNATPAENTEVVAVITPAVCALIVYFLNLSDVIGYKRRAERKKREEAFANSMDSMMQAMAEPKKQPSEEPAHETSD